MSLRVFSPRPWAALEPAGICTACFSRLIQPRKVLSRRTFIATKQLQDEISQSPTRPKYLRKAYFTYSGPSNPNAFFRGRVSPTSRSLPFSHQAALFDSAAPATTSSGLSKTTAENDATNKPLDELPHRRRQRLKAEKEPPAAEQELRPDASSRLSTLSSTLPQTSIRRKLAAFLALTKPQLSFLIVLTATTAYGLYPVPTLLNLDPSVTALPTFSTSTLTFLYLTTGTFLSCASANTINMLLEPKYDARMSRTRNRPLVRKLLSTRSAILFAIGTAVTGVTSLYFGTNPTVAGLSAFNIVLYGFVYTPLKRVSVLNTWVGAIVGGIPPLMGWVAAAGQTATTGHDTWKDLLFGPESIGGWLMAGILFAWQFPHFNSLSHMVREEYKNAGYKMMAWTNPARNGRVALRYSILMFPLCAGLYWAGVVDKGFLVGGTLVNVWLAKEGYRFWKLQGAQGTSRALFWASVWHLPLLMVGTLVAKKGIWDGVWNRVMGTEEEDEYEYEDVDEGSPGGSVGVVISQAPKTPV